MKFSIKNDRTMFNGLPSTEELKTFDQCCGIHGAARQRKGIKHVRVTLRRRCDKQIIKQEMEEIT